MHFLSFVNPTYLYVCLASLSFSRGEVVISEFLASNSGVLGAGFFDEDGDSSDWIEIENRGASDVDLSNYRLVDHIDDVATATNGWVFPDVTLESGSFLVVFASSKDRRVDLSGNTVSTLHTNFGLSADGEYLALIDSAGAVLSEFAPSYPAQMQDISYGLGGPSNDVRGFFTDPTPGSQNTVSTSGQVADTNFSVSRGLYDAPFNLEITSETLESEIRFTTDGSTPSETNGIIYSGPIAITGTTVVRAAAFRSGLFPTNVDTQSYLFLDDVRTQFSNGNAPVGWPSGSVNGQVYNYGMDARISNEGNAQEMIAALSAIPSVMLTSDVGNFTNSEDGINSNASTRGLEQPGNIEIIGGSEDLNISARCGLRIRGGASRRSSNPKHAFRTFFRSEYGDSTLAFPIFGAEGVDEFRRIDFRTAQNYSWSLEGDTEQNTFIREVLGRDLQAANGDPHTRSRYYHLYLNGIYWGLYMSQERAQADWGSSYLGGDSDEYDALKSSGTASPDGSGAGATRYDSEATDLNVEPAIPFQGTDVLGADWRRLWELMQEQTQAGNATAARYFEMQGLNPDGTRNPDFPVLLDVDNLINYMLILGFTGSYDSGLSAFVGAANNWNSVRNAVDDDRGFVHLIHDAEHSLGAGPRWAANNDRINTSNGLEGLNNFAMSNPQFFHIQLTRSTPEYRERMANLAQAALFNGGFLSPERVMELFEARRQVVDSVILAESARWGDFHADRVNDPATKADWEGAAESLRQLLVTRGEVFLGHLRAGNLYPDLVAPNYAPVERFVSVGENVTLSAGAGVIYYTIDGSDPSLPDGTVNPAAFSSGSGGSGITGFARNSDWTFLDTGVDLGSSDITVGNNAYSRSNWKHPDFDDSGWSAGPGILGFGLLGNGLTTPVATLMGQGTGPTGGNPLTSYLRRTFTVDDASAITSFTGSLLADDGAIIYLNGVQVFRENMPNGTVNFNTAAARAATNESDYSLVSFNPADLVDGENTLAVELHQTSLTSSDLGFDMDLSLLNTGGTLVTINGPVTLNARAFFDGEWSALSTNYYTTAVGPEVGDLLISEINYHPLAPDSASELAISDNDDDFEFIELINITNHDLELKGVSLSEQVVGNELEGVRFVFEEGLIIAPGDRVLVVSNREAFLSRYPDAASSVVGEFAGGLSNSGESLQLLNLGEEILSSFAYDDRAPFPVLADGEGFSLQLAELQGEIDFSNPLAWLAVNFNGSPGETGPGPFVGDPTADTDNDGSSALSEYFSGTSDNDGTSIPSSRLSLGADGGVIFSFLRDPEAFGLISGMQKSNDLSFWGDPDFDAELLSREVLTDGRILESVRVSGTSSPAAQFFRLWFRDVNAE